MRQERTGRLATEAAWQTPPGARPNRGGALVRKSQQGCFAPTARVGCLSLAATQGLEEWLPVRGWSVRTPPALQNPAYRPPGKFWAEWRLLTLFQTSARNDDTPLLVAVCSGSSILRGDSAIAVENVGGDLPLAVDVSPDHNIFANVLRRAIGAIERQFISPSIESHVAT